jgi:hypothetical protein
LDINDLLAGEQRSLLHARFGAATQRAGHITKASIFAARIRATSYPHRCAQRLAQPSTPVSE